jgi:hypothetical protein
MQNKAGDIVALYRRIVMDATQRNTTLSRLTERLSHFFKDNVRVNRFLEVRKCAVRESQDCPSHRSNETFNCIPHRLVVLDYGDKSDWSHAIPRKDPKVEAATVLWVISVSFVRIDLSNLNGNHTMVYNCAAWPTRRASMLTFLSATRGKLWVDEIVWMRNVGAQFHVTHADARR